MVDGLHRDESYRSKYTGMEITFYKLVSPVVSPFRDEKKETCSIPKLIIGDVSCYGMKIVR